MKLKFKERNKFGHCSFTARDKNHALWTARDFAENLLWL